METAVPKIRPRQKKIEDLVQLTSHTRIFVLLLLLFYYLLSPLHTVFKIIYLIQTTFLGYTVAAVLYLQSLLHVMLFRMLNVFCIFTLLLSAVVWV